MKKRNTNYRMSIVDLEENLKKELAGRKVQGMTLDDADKGQCMCDVLKSYDFKTPSAFSHIPLTDFPYLICFWAPL